jgi:20S proteasome alpha/beta subunit
MTRIVSISSSAGLIIAGDSLGTFFSVAESRTEIKVFSFLARYGVGVYGSGEVDGNGSVFEFLRNYERKLNGQKLGETLTLIETAKGVANELFVQRWKSLIGQKCWLSDNEFNECYGGLFQGAHIVGYEGKTPVIYQVAIRIQAQMFDKNETFDRAESYFPFAESEYFKVIQPDAVVVNHNKPISAPDFQNVEEMRTYAVSVIKEAATTDKMVGGEIKVGSIMQDSGFGWLEPDQCPLYS